MLVPNTCDNMKRSTCLAAILLMAGPLLHAQPQPCGTTPDMTSFCNEACIICDINGFTGINDDPQQGQAPPGFCTSTVHHMQWIGFIAGSTNLTLNVKVFGCQTGYGLEIGIYKSLDCANFQLVSNCDGDVQTGETGVFTNTTPLTIGQYYYFVMDGNHGDVCHYTVTVVNGTTAVDELPSSGAINGDLTVCPDRTEIYSLAAPAGAAWFEWTLDGAPLSAGTDTTATINWTVPGPHQLCATASNVCDTAPPSCQVIQVQPIPPINLVTSICSGDCWQGADTTICDPGFYTFHFAGQEGCDSVVNVQVNELPIDQTDLSLMICKGDTLRIGTEPFYSSGQFQTVLANQYGCDSTVNLGLQVIVCEIQGALAPDPVDCNGQPTGALHFLVKDGTPPLHYIWERIGSGQPAGSGDISAVNQEILVNNLPEGTYFITITDNFGHDLVLFGDVSEPLPLAATFADADFNGYQVSCAGGDDGWLEVLPSGGLAPYSYSWSTGSQSKRIVQLGAGAYTCTVTDVNGCTEVFSAALTEPPPLQLEARFTNPGCAGYHTGLIQTTGTSGGVPPYEYDLSGAGYSPRDSFSSLFYGNYTLTTCDANGCTADTSGTLIKPLIPQIFLSPDTTIDLGEAAQLSLLSNVPLDSILWTPAMGLSCVNCPKPLATPYRTTTYSVRVISAIDGCVDMDSLTISVLNKRDIYIPNSFSPNADGHNDYFTIFGGPEVLNVKTLEVWSRWGELVFRQDGIKPNQETLGWDGRFRGKNMEPGVFAWRAVVEYVDGLVLSYQGDVTLVW